MKNFYIFLVASFLTVQKSDAQRINIIIFCNERLAVSGFREFCVSRGEGDSTRKVAVEYHPGDLILNGEALALIREDSITPFKLHFKYSYFKNKRQHIGYYRIKVHTGYLKQPYLILNVYDFGEHKYRKWYGQYAKGENYYAEWAYPGSGFRARN